MPIITGGSGGPAPGAIVQFVDTISATPVVRLDMNDLEPYMTVTLDVSAPAFTRSLSQTMLVDGAKVNASAFGNRTLNLALELQADTDDSAAAALSVLGFELNRPSNILRVILDDIPTFYRTHRSPEMTVVMLNYALGYSSQTIPIMAEPFAFGRQVTLAGVPLHSDPTFAFGRVLDINGVLGDVETPLQIRGLSTLNPAASTVIGVRRRGIPSALTYCYQGDQMQIVGERTGSGPDSGMSGDGNSWLRSFVTGFIPQAVITIPPVADYEARGTYRLVARVRTDQPVTVQASFDFGATATGAPVLLSTLNTLTLLDLGDISIPHGQDPRYDGFSGVELPVIGAQVTISAGSDVGAEFDVDFVMLIPADDRLCTISWDPSSGVGYPFWNIIDGPSDTIYQVSLTEPLAVVPSAHFPAGGSLPMVNPGDNRLFFALDLSPGNTDSITFQQSFDVVYWPRYLTLATS